MKNRLRSMFIAAVLVGTVVAGSFTAPFSVQAAKKDTTSFEDLNQSQIVEAMGPGWNLGNQLESVTSGGNKLGKSCNHRKTHSKCKGCRL